MLAGIVRTVVQRIINDKILLGLVIVAVLGLFVGGMTLNDDKSDQAKKAQAAQQPQPDKQAMTTLPPNLATDFISWWLQSAMDFNAQTAGQNHAQAMAWMTPDAARNFQATLWTPQIAEAVTTGRLVAAFQATSIQAQAVNPDGSVVVGVSGTMVLQGNGQAMPQQFLAGFLVKKEKEGLRVAGVDPRTAVLPLSM